jgi:hypothetical protein
MADGGLNGVPRRRVIPLHCGETHDARTDGVGEAEISQPLRVAIVVRTPLNAVSIIESAGHSKQPPATEAAIGDER